MKKSTGVIFFLAVTFIAVLAITFISRRAEAPSTPVAAMTYTLAEVAQHATATDCWTAVSGGVYNLTPFVNQHPGGVANITQLCGKDGTTLFMAQHGGQAAPERELASLKIGILSK